MEIMSATLTIDPKKYARLANRIVVKAIETEEEYDHMVAAVEQLIDKGEDRLSGGVRTTGNHGNLGAGLR
jgi:hypothetical protein